MSEENIQLVRRAFERWNHGDREVREEEVDPDLELHSRMLDGVVRGSHGLKSWFREIDQQFDQWRLGISEIRETDANRLLVLGETHLHGRGSDVEFDQPMAWLMDPRDGRLARMQTSLSGQRPSKPQGSRTSCFVRGGSVLRENKTVALIEKQ